MNEYPVDPQVWKAWKLYPLRLLDGTKSECCDLPFVLVQSMPGGFITRNCPGCNEHKALSSEAFQALDLWVACPTCRQRMKPRTLLDKNYGYTCTQCNVQIRLADLLPLYEDLQGKPDGRLAAASSR